MVYLKGKSENNENFVDLWFLVNDVHGEYFHYYQLTIKLKGQHKISLVKV